VHPRSKNPGYAQGRIIHCAGCTMGGALAVRGAPYQLSFFTTLCRRSLTTIKRSLTSWVKKSAPWERISWIRVWEKGPALLWYGAPEWLIRPWLAYAYDVLMSAML